MTEQDGTWLDRQWRERQRLDQLDDVSLAQQEAHALALLPDGRVEARVVMPDDLGTYPRALSAAAVTALADAGPPDWWSETVLVLSTEGSLSPAEPAGTLHRAWIRTQPRLEQINIGESMIFQRGDADG